MTGWRELAESPVGVTAEHLAQMRDDLAALQRVCRERLVVADFLIAQPAIEKFASLISIAESRLQRETLDPDQEGSR